MENRILKMNRSALFVCLCAFAPWAAGADFAALADYKAGGSLAWFYELKSETQDLSKSAKLEASLLDVLEDKKISDEAFFYLCDVLRPIASEKSAKPLSKFLGDPFRSQIACDVLLGIGGDSVDGILRGAAENLQFDKKCRQAAIATLAARGGSANAKFIVKLASETEDADISKFAVVSAGRISDSQTADFLKDARGGDAEFALWSLALKAYKSGDAKVAAKLAKLVGDGKSYAVDLYANSQYGNDQRIKYLDTLIAKNPELAPYAGRSANFGRTYENSSKLLRSFPNLDNRAKTIAVASFMLTGDTRFFPVVAPELDSPDENLRLLAIYSARFICDDEGYLRKIYGIYKSWEKPFWGVARDVIRENPSPIVDKILRGEGLGNIDALELRAYRCDAAALRELERLSLRGDRKAQAALERSITLSELKYFARHLKTADKGVKQEIVKLIVKKIAAGKNAEFRRYALDEILGGNLEKGDKLYAFMEQKLNIAPAQSGE